MADIMTISTTLWLLQVNKVRPHLKYVSFMFFIIFIFIAFFSSKNELFKLFILLACK